MTTNRRWKIATARSPPGSAGRWRATSIELIGGNQARAQAPPHIKRRKERKEREREGKTGSR